MGDDVSGVEILEINNQLLDRENTIFTHKERIRGNIKTVVPDLGVLSTSEKYHKNRNLIDAFDMEFEGYYRALASTNIKLNAAFYFMNKEDINIKLKNTYYYRPYLKNLYNDFNRGKYYCFEMVINWLLEN